MSDGFQFYDIIFFALIAIFIILRLRGVLGRRTGHERNRHPDRFARAAKARGAPDEEAQGEVIHLPDHQRPEPDRDPEEGAPLPPPPRPSFSAKEPAPEEKAPAAPVGLRAVLEEIRRRDQDFAPKRFVEGAQAAFEMVVDAFAKGDTPTLRRLLDDDVYDEFAAAIRERLAEGHSCETTIVAIDKAEIIEGEMRGNVARVTVKFVSQQINLVRDKEGEEVGGDSRRIERITDLWTFARNTRSADPNWTLVETSVPA